MRADAENRAGQMGGAKRRTVPYIASWSAEERPSPRLITLGRFRGIAYEDEVPHDRDSHGVLWRRTTISPGRGQPKYASVHTARQRRVMRQLRCQVCANPSDRTDQGVLWLLGDDRHDWPNWPEQMGATHPSVCLPCAALSVRLCPYLRRGYVAVRVRNPEIGGVYGAFYQPGPDGPRPFDFGDASYGDPRLAWTLASQLVMRLQDCTFVDLDTELAAAGLPTLTAAGAPAAPAPPP